MVLQARPTENLLQRTSQPKSEVGYYIKTSGHRRDLCVPVLLQGGVLSIIHLVPEVCDVIINCYQNNLAIFPTCTEDWKTEQDFRELFHVLCHGKFSEL